MTTDEHGIMRETGSDNWGLELLDAIEAQDGQKTAVILRELMYLCGWNTAQNVAFRANFQFIGSDDKLQWWISVPDSAERWDSTLFHQLCQIHGREQSMEGAPLAG